jgi:hypothetical protein
LYQPATVGNYTVTVKFLELHYLWNSSSAERNYYGVLYDSASYAKNLVVQEDPVLPTGWEDTPLPTEYWTRPIEGTNTRWFQVASNWLSEGGDEDLGGTGNQIQQAGIAPNSAHIVWTKPTEDGGLVGGANYSVPGEVFNAGHQYQTRFTNPIIMWGRLYYEVPIQWAGGGGGWMCVDLRTGETIWYNQSMGVGGVPAPSFGYYYDLDDMNNHGVVTPGWLFSNNFGASIHPRYGIIGRLNLTSVPSGYAIRGPKGEQLRYVLNSAGWLAQWNSSLVFNDSESGVINASGSNRYDWNVSATWRVGMSNVAIQGVSYGQYLFGTNGSHPVVTSGPRFDYPSPVTIWCISLKPGQEGQLLYMKNIDTIPNPPDGGEIMLERVADGVAVFVKLFERRWIGYDVYTGNKLWETDPPEADFNPFGYYSFPSLIHTESVTVADG